MNPYDKTMLSGLIKWWDTLPDLHTLIMYSLFGWMMAPILQFVERFLWSDWEFMGFLVVLIFLDAITSAIIEYKNKKLSSIFFQDLILKAFAYSVVLITIHVISNHTVKGNPNSILASVLPFLDAVIYAAILIKEALSINENLTHLGFPLLPKFFVRKLKQFSDKGFGSFKSKNDENQDAI